VTVNLKSIFDTPQKTRAQTLKIQWNEIHGGVTIR